MDEEQQSLKLIPEQEPLSASGYKHTGSSLHNQLHGTNPTRFVDRLQKILDFITPILCLISLSGLALAIGITFHADILPFALTNRAPRLLSGSIGLLILAGLSLSTKQYIHEWYLSAQEESAMTLSCLVDSNNAPAIMVDSPDNHQIKSIYEMVDPPCRLQATDCAAADLVERLSATPVDESFRIAEFFITEDKKKDNLVIDNSATISEQEAVHLPLDEIVRRLRDHPSPVMVQLIITPRELQKAIDERQMDIRYERDYGLLGAIGNALAESVAELITDDHLSDPDPREPDELTGDASRRYDGLEQVNGRKAFSVNLRAIAVGTPETADAAFDIVQGAVDETLTEFVSVEYNSYAGPASQETTWSSLWNPKGRVWDQFQNQTPRRRDDIPLRPKRTPAFVADAETIWNYLLVSTKTGAGEEWAHGAGTRDTQPTETPASDEYSEYQWDGSFGDLAGEPPSTSESER